jgi:hypothetical protein
LVYFSETEPLKELFRCRIFSRRLRFDERNPAGLQAAQHLGEHDRRQALAAE